MKFFKYNGASILLIIGLFILWEIAVRINVISIHILPPPSDVFETLYVNWPIIAVHTWQTIIESIIGLIISVFFGLSIAVLLDYSGFIRKCIYPVLVASQTIPMIALAPLLLIWLGFGITPKLIIVVLYCFFPIAIAVTDGFSDTDPKLIKLLKSMGASNFQILKLIKLPGALPNFFSGLRIAATYSMTGAIVGEYVGAYQGLGVYIQTSANSFAVSSVFAAIFVVVILSILQFSIVSLLEKYLIPWNQYKKESAKFNPK